MEVVGAAPAPNWTQVQVQLATISGQLEAQQATLQELKSSVMPVLTQHERDLHSLQITYVQQCARLEDHTRGLASLEIEAEQDRARLKELEKLAPVTRAVLWVSVAMGTSLVGLIVSVITGRVRLVFGP